MRACSLTAWYVTWAKSSSAQSLRAKPTKGEARWQQTPVGQVVDGWHQLLQGEVPGDAEHDKRARPGQPGPAVTGGWRDRRPPRPAPRWCRDWPGAVRESTHGFRCHAVPSPKEQCARSPFGHLNSEPHVRLDRLQQLVPRPSELRDTLGPGGRRQHGEGAVRRGHDTRSQAAPRAGRRSSTTTKGALARGLMAWMAPAREIAGAGLARAAAPAAVHRGRLPMSSSTSRGPGLVLAPFPPRCPRSARRSSLASCCRLRSSWAHRRISTPAGWKGLVR